MCPTILSHNPHAVTEDEDIIGKGGRSKSENTTFILKFMSPEASLVAPLSGVLIFCDPQALENTGKS